MATDTLGWQTLAHSWIDKCDVKWASDYKQIVLDLFNWIFPPVIILVDVELYFYTK